MKQCNYSAVYSAAMFAFATLSPSSTVHEHPFLAYGLFKTPWVIVEGHFYMLKAHLKCSLFLFWRDALKKMITEILSCQFMHSGQSYVHIHHNFSPCESSTMLLFKDCGRKAVTLLPSPFFLPQTSSFSGCLLATQTVIYLYQSDSQAGQITQVLCILLWVDVAFSLSCHQRPAIDIKWKY